MPGKIDGMKPPFVPIGGFEGISSRKPLMPTDRTSQFHDMLVEKLEEEQGIKFSSHARARMESRNIPMSAENMMKLSDAMDRARDKGARESLILMQDAAFVVNVNNRTVITAMDDAKLRENVFTNIDSAVIVR